MQLKFGSHSHRNCYDSGIFSSENIFDVTYSFQGHTHSTVAWYWSIFDDMFGPVLKQKWQVGEWVYGPPPSLISTAGSNFRAVTELMFCAYIE